MMLPNRSTGRLQGASFPSARWVRTSLACVLRQNALKVLFVEHDHMVGTVPTPNSNLLTDAGESGDSSLDEGCLQAGLVRAPSANSTQLTDARESVRWLR